jgi:hypothetical protein
MHQSAPGSLSDFVRLFLAAIASSPRKHKDGEYRTLMWSLRARQGSYFRGDIGSDGRLLAMAMHVGPRRLSHAARIVAAGNSILRNLW